MHRRFIVALFAIGASHLALAQNEAPELPSGWTPKKPVSTRYDMVAAANPLAVEAGHQILKQGGSAVDAAVAVQIVLNLVEPQSSGIGGGAFMLFHNGRNGLLTAYDGRETAPAAAKLDRFLDKEGKPLKFYDAVVGGKSIGVPGTLPLLELAHRQYMPPPSSGGTTVLQILGIFEPFDMKALGVESLISVHLITEAGRLADADRNQDLADPDFVKPPAGLTDPAYLHERSALIKLDASMGRAKAYLRLRGLRRRRRPYCATSVRVPRSNFHRRRTFRSSTNTAMRGR